MPGMARRMMPRPAPNRADSLWRQCLFAFAGGWFKGTGADGFGIFDNVTGGRGIFGAVNTKPHVHDVGWMLDASIQTGGRTTLSFAAPAGRYNIPRAMSVAVCAYQRTADLVGFNTRLCRKRLNTGSAGWDVHIDQLTGRWRFECGDGATEATVGNYVRTLTENDVLVFTYDRTNLRSYHNGLLDDTVAAAVAVGDNTEPLLVFPPLLTGEIQDADISLLAVWSRVLAPSEIGRLWADPYVMWHGDRAGRAGLV